MLIIVCIAVNSLSLIYSIWAYILERKRKRELGAAKKQQALAPAPEESTQRVWRNNGLSKYSFPNLQQFEKKFAEADKYESKDKTLIYTFAQEVHDKYNISFDDIKVCVLPRLFINKLQIEVYGCSGRIKVCPDYEVIFAKGKLTDEFEKLCLEKVA